VLQSKRVVLATGQTQPRIPSWVPAQQRSDNRTADKTIIHSDWMRVNDVAFRKSIKDKVHSLAPSSRTDLCCITPRG
jgi:hypothetical protein